MSLDQQSIDFIRERHYENLRQYPVEDVLRELQYCIEHPEPQVVEIVSFSKSWDRWDIERTFHRVNQKTGESFESVVPEGLVRSLFVKLQAEGFTGMGGKLANPDAAFEVLEKREAIAAYS